MSTLHEVYLPAEEVRQVALPILAAGLDKYGFSTASIAEEEDFDGEYVLRMTAEVTAVVPAKELISTMTNLNAALRRRGDNRYVYLRTHRPGDAEPEEEPEE